MKARCFYCGKKVRKGGPGAHFASLKTRDHIIPKAQRRIDVNMLPMRLQLKMTLTCCFECNRKKRDQDPLTFIATLNLPTWKIDRIREVVEINNANL